MFIIEDDFRGFKKLCPYKVFNSFNFFKIEDLKRVFKE